MSGFSSALKVTDLNDFIAPSQECVKPITSVPSKSTKKGAIAIEGSEDSPQPLEKVKITLNDCLACSGCITSAEVVLVNEQSIEQFVKVLEENKECVADDKKIIILSLSVQSVLSLGIKYNLDGEMALSKIIGYFKSIGVDYVYDLNYAKCLSVIEAQKEFVERYQQKHSGNQCLPMLTSACPGFVCYAEKTHGPLLVPHISSTRSPQQVMGALIKKHLAAKKGWEPQQIYHASLMPCFDKKLEASRQEFLVPGSEVKEVDCVITTVELEEMLTKREINIHEMATGCLDAELSLCSSLETLEGSGSGGFAHHVFLHAASTLFQQNLQQLQWKVMRNNDLQELTLEVEGQTKLHFALVYGFKNIQNLVQKIKRKKCPYDYVEIMACPSGCLNGGAQSRPTKDQSHKELVAQMQKTFESLPKFSVENPKLRELYCEWLGSADDPSVKQNLHTSYNVIEKTINPLVIKW